MPIQAQLCLTFEPPHAAGAYRVTWALDGHAPVVYAFQAPFAPQHWDLVLRALNARQHPDYDQFPYRFQPDGAEIKALSSYGLWDIGAQRLITDLHQQVGRRLGQTLLANQDVRVLIQAIRDADGEIVLAFAPDQEGGQHIGALPWELAFDGVQPWLLRGGRVLSCVRLFAESPPHYSAPERPHILLLTPHAGFTDMTRRYEREARRHIRDAFGERAIIELLEPPLTMTALDARLRNGPPPTIIDYYGHGLLHNGQGHLLLDDDAGGTDTVSAARLQALPRLAPIWIICACQSAEQPLGEELAASLAPALVAHPQVAAVLAMQLSIRMSAATDQIVPAVYQALAGGASIQSAAAEARRRLYAAEKDSASFYIPTLYVRQQTAAPIHLQPSGLQLPPPPRPVLPTGNPFTPGVVVPPEQFAGRKHELAEIVPALENMLSISIVGDARIGKSSLLRYLEANLGKRMARPESYLPMYLSMDQQRGQANFCRAILERLLPYMPPTSHEAALRELQTRVERNQEISIEELTRVLEWARSAGLRIVLLLDEFKELLKRPDDFDEVFRGALRSLYTNQIIALALATRQPLRDIPGLNSYFVNGITRVNLGSLGFGEDEELLQTPGNHPFGDDELRLALDVGQRHPLRLQLAGYLLYNAKTQPSSPFYDQPDVLSDRAHDVLRREVQRQFDEMIAASRPPARRSGVWNWIDGLGGAAMRAGDAADTAQARMLGVLIVLGIIVIAGLLFACALGIISPAELGNLLRVLTGGSE